jgi:hypothetical protein
MPAFRKSRVYFRDSRVGALSEHRAGTDYSSTIFLRRRGHPVTLAAFYWAANYGGSMTEQEAVKQSADLLRRIIRSVDKKLEYNFLDPTQEGRFSLRLSTRGRVGTVSLLTNDLRLALLDNVSKNVIRQKIKSTRDHLLSNYVEDVMGKKMARMLKESSAGNDAGKSSFFYRRPQGRR